jgi:ribonuclease Z
MLLTILGTGSGGPFLGRNFTSQILRAGNDLFLLDCGEGTQMQLFRLGVRYDRLRHIFISHLHGDHVFGLVGLLTSFSLKNRTAPLALYSPPGLRELVETTFRVCGVRLSYRLDFNEVEADVSSRVFENAGLEVWTVPLRHRVPCTGWLFREKPRPRHMRGEMIEVYSIPYEKIPALKAGADLTLPDGRVIPNRELTTPSDPPRAYAFCSDTAFSEAVADMVRGVDLLYHEATFTSDEEEEAAFSFHSTAGQAAEIARRAGVGRLLLGHFSGRYQDLEQHLREARAVFDAADLAEEGGHYEV